MSVSLAAVRRRVSLTTHLACVSVEGLVGCRQNWPRVCTTTASDVIIQRRDLHSPALHLTVPRGHGPCCGLTNVTTQTHSYRHLSIQPISTRRPFLISCDWKQGGSNRLARDGLPPPITRSWPKLEMTPTGGKIKAPVAMANN